MLEAVKQNGVSLFYAAPKADYASRLEDAKQKLWTQKSPAYDTGKPVWLDFARTPEENKPVRMIHRAHEQLEAIFLNKGITKKVEKFPRDRRIKVESHIVVSVYKGSLKWGASAKEVLTQDEMDEILSFAESRWDRPLADFSEGGQSACVRAVSINVRGTLGSREAVDSLLREVTSQWPDLDMLFCAELDFFMKMSITIWAMDGPGSMRGKARGLLVSGSRRGCVSTESKPCARVDRLRLALTGLVQRLTSSFFHI